MTNTETVWDCPTRGKALISGASCPQCGSLRSAVQPLTAQPDIAAQPSNNAFVLHSEYQDFLTGRSD